jgi:hypothetical protein
MNMRTIIMLSIDMEKLSLEEIAQAIELLSGNKIEIAIWKGLFFLAALARFPTPEEFWDWVRPNFGQRYAESTVYNFMDLARCVTTDNYPRNFKLSALYEWAARKYDRIRDQILALLKDKERVSKPDVIAAAAMIESGGEVESADDLRKCQTSPTATSSPMLSIRCGSEKSRKYDLRSKDEFQALLRFIADLAAPHQNPAFLAACLPDAVSREELFRMDAVRDDVSTVASSGNAVPDSPPGIEVVALPSSRIVLRPVASRKDMIRPRPTESH